MIQNMLMLQTILPKCPDSTHFSQYKHPSPTHWHCRHAASHHNDTAAMPRCMTIRYFLQKAVPEHKATYSDDHARDFIDIYLKEMKKREKTDEISSFSGESSLLVLSVTHICIHTLTLTTGMNKATCSAYSLQRLHSINPLPDEQLVVAATDLLFPAVTTVSTTLNYVLAFLLKYPKVQTKMRQEMDKVVGRDRLPTLDDRAR